MQVEVVRLLTLGTRCGIDCAASASQYRQQSILHVSTELLLQADQVIGTRGNAALPKQALGRNIDRLESHRQLIALPTKVSSDQASHAQVRAYLVRIQIERHILSRYGRRPHIQRSRVGQYTGQLIGQCKPEIINAEVSIQIL